MNDTKTVDVAVELLRTAHRAVLADSPPADRFTQATLHLITCAADMVEQLRERDLDAARQALGCARAAVVTATYAVQQIDADTRASAEILVPGGK